MPKLYVIVAGLVLFIAYSGGLWLHGNHHGKQTAELQTAKAWLDSAEVARKIHDKQQKGVNDALRKQNENLAAINARQLDDIERLQQRADRAELPKAARAECKGSTGAELSRQDAKVLVGEAARADTIREGLRACYSTLDAIRGSN